MAAPAWLLHATLVATSCHCTFWWSLCHLLSWIKEHLAPSLLGPNCSGFPPLHIFVLTCLSGQASPRLGAFPCFLSVWNTCVCLSLSPLACTSPLQCSFLKVWAPFCHPWVGEGGCYFYFFYRRRDLATAESPQGQASLFLYLGCSECWPGSVTETSHSVEPLIHWVDWRGSGEHWLI